MGDFNYPGKLKRSVLIVDDEEINRMILGNILEENYEIFYAENGAQALEMLTERRVRFSLMVISFSISIILLVTLRLDIQKLIEHLTSVSHLLTRPHGHSSLATS